MEKLALIMAAGEGTRMLSSTPKMLHNVCGMAMVEHVLRALSPVCAQKVMIVGHGKEKMMEVLHGQAEFVEQDPNGWGTGCAVRSAVPFLKGKHGQVIVTAGDMPLVLPETYARLMSEVEKGNACAMLTDIIDNPFGYGRVIRENGRVCAIVEQKDLTGAQGRVKEMNASVYCFDIDALLWALPRLGNDNHAHEYYLTDVIRILYAGGYSITTAPVLEKSECMGINDRAQLAEAECQMRARINKRHMKSGVTIIDPANTYIQQSVTIGRDTVLYPGCVLEKNTSIDSGCVLYASRVSASHIGAGARIEQSVIVDSYIEPGRKVGPFESINPGNRPIAKA